MSCDLVHQARTRPKPARLVGGGATPGAAGNTPEDGSPGSGSPGRTWIHESARFRAGRASPAPRPMVTRRSAAVGEDWARAGGRADGRGGASGSLGALPAGGAE